MMSAHGDQPQSKDLIEFWFDFDSPYAFFASLTVENIAQRHARRVVWRPFMLGAILKTTGMQPLNKTPMRGDYALHDWARLARYHKVGFSLPPNHPVTSLPASRIFYWLDERDEAVAIRFARRAFHAYYTEGADMTQPEGAAALAAEITPFSIAELVAGALSPAIKDKVRAQTEEALRRGIFGSPFFIVDHEPFWGADRLPMIDEWLATKGW